MKESDYILASHVTTVMHAEHLVRDLIPTVDIPEDELKQVATLLQSWRVRMFAKINAAK